MKTGTILAIRAVCRLWRVDSQVMLSEIRHGGRRTRYGFRRVVWDNPTGYAGRDLVALLWLAIGLDSEQIAGELDAPTERVEEIRLMLARSVLFRATQRAWKTAKLPRSLQREYDRELSDYLRYGKDYFRTARYALLKLRERRLDSRRNSKDRRTRLDPSDASLSNLLA